MHLTACDTLVFGITVTIVAHRDQTEGKPKVNFSSKQTEWVDRRKQDLSIRSSISCQQVDNRLDCVVYIDKATTNSSKQFRLL